MSRVGEMKRSGGSSARRRSGRGPAAAEAEEGGLGERQHGQSSSP